MNIVNLFLGSSVKLMKVRNAVGDTVRKLNDKWLKQGVTIQLHIWEEYTVGYSGKHKQDEYIDEMVLKSDLSFFMFSDRIGKFTRMELEAKLNQNKVAAICFQLPIKGNYDADVASELLDLNVNPIMAQDKSVVCDEIEKIVETFIKSNGFATGIAVNTKDIYFYTTIPQDIKAYRSQIGSTIRDLDVISIGSYGVHCVLHPLNSIGLLDETDHYIPLLKEKVSDGDYAELETGARCTKDSAHRLTRMSVFDFGDIYKRNPKVKQLLDDYGIFTDNAQGLDSVKWKLLKWIFEYKEYIAMPLSDVKYEGTRVTLDNHDVVAIDSIDETGTLAQLVSRVDSATKEISVAKTTLNDKRLAILIQDLQTIRQTISLVITDDLNGWTKLSAKGDEEYNQLIQDASKAIQYINASNYRDVLGLYVELEQRIRAMVADGMCSPYLLLATQMNEVSIFDTFADKNSGQPKEEDELYLRILTDAEKFSLKIPLVEAMRLNVGNMYSRMEDYPNARLNYQIAFNNLQDMNDHTINHFRQITMVLMHWQQLEQTYGSKESSAEVLSLFKHHIARLNVSDDAYIVDQCEYITCELTALDIEDDSQIALIESAENLYGLSKERLHINAADDVYGDIYIYMPNMIARYYIDHKPTIDGDNSQWFVRAKCYLKEVLANCEKRFDVSLAEGLFHKGEALHQLGYLYSFVPELLVKSMSNYLESICIKRRLYALIKEASYETCIAQTLVNLGAVELQVLERGMYRPDKCLDGVQQALTHANEAVEIYAKHIRSEDENSERTYFEALQLKGTLLYYLHSLIPKAVILYNEAIELLYKCWIWNKEHPANQYRRTFITNAGKILLDRKFISQQEFDDVVQKCGIAFD